MKKNKIINKKSLIKRSSLLWILGILFIVSQIHYTIQTSSRGAKMVSLEKEIQGLSEENLKLQNKIVDLSSLNKLSQKTEGLRFIKADKTIYIKVEDTFAGILK